MRNARGVNRIKFSLTITSPSGGFKYFYIMAYIYLNKETREARIFGGISILCKATGLKPDNLYTHFGRKGLKEFESDNFRIVKAEIERGG